MTDTTQPWIKDGKIDPAFAEAVLAVVRRQERALVEFRTFAIVVAIGAAVIGALFWKVDSVDSHVATNAAALARIEEKVSGLAEDVARIEEKVSVLTADIAEIKDLIRSQN